MKKLFILGVTCLMTFPLTACIADKVEKEPVVIENVDEANSEPTKDEVLLSDEVKQETSVDDISASSSGDKETAQQPNAESDITQDDAEDNNNNNNDNINDDNTYKSTVMLEGMEEEVTYKTFKSDLGYQIAYDVDRFTATYENEKDTFMAENPDPELYPYVYFTIGRNEYTGDEIDINDSDLYLRDDETGKNMIANAKEDTVKLGEYEAIHWALYDGSEWNSLVKHYYYIPGETHYYWIQTSYFLEASEGFGARILAMLDTFVIE